MLRWLLLLLLAAPPSVAPPAPVRIVTAHYSLLADTSPARAKELAAVLEAAWPEYAKFFGATPKLGKNEHLPVRFCATRASFEAALRVDHQYVPKSGGYYAPGNRTAYLWRQPTSYYTCCLLLHECAHQFHFLSRTGNHALGIEWYVEGTAEYLARHQWDGKHLTLGVRPLISLKDYAKTALAELDSGADLTPAGKTGVLSRPLAWALYRFLETKRNRRRFQRLKDIWDRGVGKPSDLFRVFGHPKGLTKKLHAWLESEQTPWCQVFNQWEEIAPDRIRGVAGPWITSFCRLKGEAVSLDAKLEIPSTTSFTGGLLLAFRGNDDYTVALVLSGKRILVNRRKDGKWTTLLSAACPGPAKQGLLALAARWEGAKVHFFVEGKEIGAFALSGRTLGLALQGGTATYRDVHWTLPERTNGRKR